MAASPGTSMPWVKAQFFDNNADPAASHLLFTYLAGTSTPATTYSDAGLTTANANPIVLDSAGRASIFYDRSYALKFVLSPPGDSTPPESPVWTRDPIVAVPYYSILSSIDRDSEVTWTQWAVGGGAGIDQELQVSDSPVILYNEYVNNGTGSDTVDIPAGTLTPILATVGDGLILEWEVDYASATLSARAECFGTAVDIGTGAASTLTRARYCIYRVDNTSVHVSTLVYQNTGANNPQVAMSEQTIGSLNLTTTDYTVDMKMSAGTWTIRGARCYFTRAYGDWTAR